MRDKQIFGSLAGWRDECYETRLKFSDEPVFKVRHSGDNTDQSKCADIRIHSKCEFDVPEGINNRIFSSNVFL